MHKDDVPFKNYDHARKMADGFHFTIDRDGRWYCHDGAMGTGPIKNERISKLFAGAGEGRYAGKGLSRDGEGKYWLKAPPADVYSIDVEDVPFIVTAFRTEGARLVLTTNFGEDAVLGNGKTFHLNNNIPYVEIRDGLSARIGRNVFYQLAEMAESRNGTLGLQFGEDWHSLGYIA